MQSSAVALPYREHFFKQQFKGGLKSSLPCFARLSSKAATLCHRFAGRNNMALIRINFWRTQIFAHSAEYTSKKKCGWLEGIHAIRSDQLYGGRREESHDFCPSVCCAAAP